MKFKGGIYAPIREKRKSVFENTGASYLTLASIRESIVNSVKAGLLTCNIFTVLPILIAQDSGFLLVKTFGYLQLRDSS